MKKYWESKPDITVDTGKNILNYWREEGKLQVCMPYWTDSDGNQKQGKTVTINIDAVQTTPEAVRLFEKLIADIT